MATCIHLVNCNLSISALVSVVFMLEPKLKSSKKLEECLFPFPRAAAFHPVKSAKFSISRFITP